MYVYVYVYMCVYVYVYVYVYIYACMNATSVKHPCTPRNIRTIYVNFD